MKRACLALIGVCLGWLTGCGEKTAGPEPLKVGMDLSYPPFETIDANGVPTGVSVDLAEALGRYLNRPVRIENIPFTGLIPALQTGKVDVVISSMTANDERRRSIDFSDPYLDTGLCLLVAKDSGIRSLADADQPGRVLVVRQGTTGEAFAASHIKQAKVLRLEKESSAVLEVVQGKADAFLYDQMSVWKNWRQHPDKTEAVLEPVQKESWAVGIRKGNDELREQVNAFLKAFRAEGGFDKLGEKYLKEQKEAFRQQDIPFYF